MQGCLDRCAFGKTLMLTLLAGSVWCGVASAQGSVEMGDPGEDEPADPVFYDGVPRIWSWGNVQGNAASDARFRQLVQANLQYLTSQGGAVPLDGSGHPDRSGYAIGYWFGEKVHTLGLSAGRVALFVNSLGWGNQKTGYGDTAYRSDTSGTNSNYTRLYHHPSDAISDSDPVYNLAETPWLNDGIAETLSWTNAFVSGYNNRKSAYSLPNIDRAHQDQEPQGISDYRTGFDNGVYWTKVKADSRWDAKDGSGQPTAEARVPGFPGLTLKAIFDDALLAGVPDISSTSSGTDKEKWEKWYRGVLKQAESQALEEAFFVPLRTAYGTLGSDYEGTLRLDGGNSGNNSHLSGGWYPECSGMKLAWDGKGDLQAPSTYGVSSAYGIEGTPLNVNYVWPSPMERTLDDGVTFGSPYSLSSPEPLFDAALRQHRYTYNAGARSFSGAYKDKFMPYLPMVGQFWIPGGGSFYNASTNPNPVPFSYSTYMYRIPDDGVRRLLMLARSRNAKELCLWNETFYVGKHANYYDMNTNNPYQWNRIKAMVDQVWKYTVSSASVNAGTTSGTVTNLRTAPDTFVQHTLAANTDSILTVNFSNAYGSSVGLRLNVEAESTVASTVSAEIQNGSSWLTVDLDPTSSATSLAVAANKRVNVTGRVVLSSGTFSGSTLTARVKFAGSSGASGNRTVKYDLVQLAADDDTHRKFADFNGDGTVDETDLNLFEQIFIDSCHTTGITDVNHDGFIDFTDYYDFLDAYDVGDPAADVNQDSFIDFSDYDLFALFWDMECIDSNGIDYMVDLNYDGKVDVTDWNLFLGAYDDCVNNSNCPAATFE